MHTHTVEFFIFQVLWPRNSSFGGYVSDASPEYSRAALSSQQESEGAQQMLEYRPLPRALQV